MIQRVKSFWRGAQFLLALALFFLVTQVCLTGEKPASGSWNSIPMKKAELFGSACVCMDGRCQHAIEKPTEKLVKKIAGVKGAKVWVDRITEQGINVPLSDPKNERHIWKVENIRQRLEISVRHHDAKVITLSAHNKCAANPAPKAVQINQLRKAKETVEAFDFVKKAKVPVRTFWIEEVGKKKQWKAIEVK